MLGTKVKNISFWRDKWLQGEAFANLLIHLVHAAELEKKAAEYWHSGLLNWRREKLQFVLPQTVLARAGSREGAIRF